MFNIEKMYKEEIMSFVCEIETIGDLKIKKQLYAILLCWHKDIYNYTLDDIKTFFDRVKTKKIKVNFKPIETYVNTAIRKDFWRAWEEMMLDLTPSMIIEKMGHMFEKYEEQPETSQIEEVQKIQAPVKKTDATFTDGTIISVLVELYGSVSSAKTFITKNSLDPNDTDWRKALEIIAKSTSKYKTKAKEMLEA